MNRIKKFISLFIVFALLISVSSTAFAAEKNSISSDDYNHVLELFQTLGIIEDYDNFSDTKVITRGYFALVAARLYNMPFDDIAKEQRFSDVPLYSSYVDAIELLASNGAISGDGTGVFREDERIKIIDAAKILVEIAGYGFIAQSSGGYPNGYAAAANEAGILKRIGSLDNYLTADTMLVMITNMLNAYDIKMSFVMNGQIYEKDTEKNLLKKLFDVDIVEGVVTQNSLTAFYSAPDISDNEIEITSNTDKYVLYTEEYGKYIGKKIKAFYIEDFDKDRIIYAYPLSGEDDIKVLKISDIYLSLSRKAG